MSASPAPLPEPLPPESPLVRSFAPADATFAAELHEQSLPHGFFGRLGVRFLAAYYRSFAASPHAVAFVAAVDGRPAGVLVGTLRTRAHYAWVVNNHWWPLGRAGAAALLVRPRELAFFLRTRSTRYVRRLTAASAARRPARPTGPARRSAVLTHVAVDSDVRGSGAGAALVETFLDAAREDGCDVACLVTLAGGAGAGAFYESLGWTCSHSRTDHDGRPIDEYTREL